MNGCVLINDTETVVRRCSVKKVFVEISQNSQENTCARDSSLMKLQGEAWDFINRETLAQVWLATLKSEWQRCFPKNFAKFLRTPFPKLIFPRFCFEKLFSIAKAGVLF